MGTYLFDSRVQWTMTTLEFASHSQWDTSAAPGFLQKNAVTLGSLLPRQAREELVDRRAPLGFLPSPVGE